MAADKENDCGKEREFFGEVGICARRGGQCGRTWKHMAVSVSGREVRRRDVYPDLFNFGGELWVYPYDNRICDRP